MNQEDKQSRLNQSSSRRALLSGAGRAAALGAAAMVLGACTTSATRRSANDIGTRCMTILYPNGADTKFDLDYYKGHHLPLIMKLYGKAIAKFELRKGLPGPDGSKPPYVATVHIYIADQQAFDEAGAKHGQTLIDDVPNFSSVMPIIQVDEVYEIAES